MVLFYRYLSGRHVHPCLDFANQDPVKIVVLVGLVCGTVVLDFRDLIPHSLGELDILGNELSPKLGVKALHEMVEPLTSLGDGFCLHHAVHGLAQDSAEGSLVRVVSRVLEAADDAGDAEAGSHVVRNVTCKKP